MYYDARMDAQAETMYTVDEVAERLRVHPNSVRRWLRAGVLDGTPLGGRAGWRIPASSVAAFLAERHDRPTLRRRPGVDPSPGGS